MRKGLIIGFLIYLFFGIYFFNSSLGFVKLPDIVLKADRWMTLIGGILIVIGAINYVRISKRKKVLP